MAAFSITNLPDPTCRDRAHIDASAIDFAGFSNADCFGRGGRFGGTCRVGAGLGRDRTGLSQPDAAQRLVANLHGHLASSRQAPGVG